MKIFLSVIILGVCMISVFTSCNRENGKAVSRNSDSSEPFEYVALGDSIPNGYSVAEDDDLAAYPQLLAESIEREKGVTVKLCKYTKNGLTAGGLYEKYLSDAKVQEDLRKADLITITIGANDILNKFRELYAEVENGISDNPKLLIEAAEIVSGWDSGEFEEDWKNMMEHVRQNRKEDAKIIVTTIYNPVGEIEGLRSLSQAAATVIDEMNGIITENEEAYGYQIADVSAIRTDNYLQSDGLHPNQEGQRLIMEKIREKD